MRGASRVVTTLKAGTRVIWDSGLGGARVGVAVMSGVRRKRRRVGRVGSIIVDGLDWRSGLDLKEAGDE